MSAQVSPPVIDTIPAEDGSPGSVCAEDCPVTDVCPGCGVIVCADHTPAELCQQAHVVVHRACHLGVCNDPWVCEDIGWPV